MKPYLQLALDVTSLDQAFKILALEHLVDTVDIIEAGTVLLASEGKNAVTLLHKHYPNKRLVADFKIADAITTIGSMLFEAGANLITVIAAADIATMASAVQLADHYGQSIQIELYGRWDLELAAQWHNVGIQHVIYHHARDASKPWDSSDLEKIKALIELGFQVSVTGGLKPENVVFFQGLELYSFIIGRSLYEASDPLVVASAFQTQLTAYFK
jgi:3-dehydro-L-gulonate-6-phosphate decarboxylase